MRLVVLTDSAQHYSQILPSLDLLGHDVLLMPLTVAGNKLQVESPDVLLIDGTGSLLLARNTAQMLKSSGLSLPLIMVLTEGGMAAVSSGWMVDDIVLDSVGPAELEARLRLAHAQPDEAEVNESVIRSGAVLIDEASYTARLDGVPLNLTYKEFELLKFLAQSSGRVFTRAQLLAEVWGYDYYGGTRTVDVHIRRLRSKLGTEHEHLISTVRNVGYSFNAPKSGESQ